MRMVGNMSSSVDYRVITIIDAPGMGKGRVTLKKSDQQRKKRTEIYNNPTQGKERTYSAHKQLAEIMAL